MNGLIEFFIPAFRRWWFALFVCINLIMNPTNADERVVTFVGDPWPPYVEGEMGKDADSGIAVKIVYEIFSRIDNTSARFPLIPWQRALQEVEKGYHDGIGLLLKTPERKVYMRYSVPFIVGASLVWSASLSDGKPFEWEQIKDFYGKRVGIIQGYSYGDSLEQAFKSKAITTVVAPTVEHMFAMLANDRIDLALANDAVGAVLARKYPEAGIAPARKPTDADTYYLAISKKSSAVALIPEINQIIMALQSEGFIDRMIRGD